MSTFPATITLFLLATSRLLVHQVHADGMTFANCRTQADCSGTRACRDLLTSQSPEECAINGVYCICFPDQPGDFFCEQQSDCDSEETCQEIPEEITEASGSLSEERVCIDNSQLPYFEDPRICENDGQCGSNSACITIFGYSFCANKVSPRGPDDSPVSGEDAVPVPSDAEDKPEEEADGNTDDDPEGSSEPGNVCIAAKSLRHLPQHMLTYKSHIRSSVLCDPRGSCATPGHMVNFRGAVMMMQTYCASVGCVRAVMPVNSLRYSRNTQIPSDTDGLMFTAFAARYNSALEETILRAAVFMGL